MTFRPLCVAVLTCTICCVATGPASAQFRVLPGYYGRAVAPDFYARGYGYNPYAFHPYYGNPYAYGAVPYSGYMNGAAGVISAQGQYLINTQQAYLLKEQVRQAQLDYRHRAYDEWLYERANTPTLNDERERIQREELRRARNVPPQTEIWAGTSLNELLFDIQQMQGRGAVGPNVPLDDDILQQINVRARDQGNQGLLKDAGKLSWPFALQTLPQAKEGEELRARIDKTLLQAKDEAVGGRLDAKAISDLQRDIKRLRQLLFDQVNEVSFGDYTDAKRYLNQLDEAVNVLKQPDAGNYVNGKYSARGRNVRELVQYMTDNGLRFAPAVSGQEAAYNALYHALLSYDIQEAATTPPSPAAPR